MSNKFNEIRPVKPIAAQKSKALECKSDESKQSTSIRELVERHRAQIEVVGAKSVSAVSHSPQFLENRISYSVTEFAAHTGLSPKSVERMIKRGEIQAKRVGRRVLIPIRAIEAWLHQSE